MAYVICADLGGNPEARSPMTSWRNVHSTLKSEDLLHGEMSVWLMTHESAGHLSVYGGSCILIAFDRWEGFAPLAHLIHSGLWPMGLCADLWLVTCASLNLWSGAFCFLLGTAFRKVIFSSWINWYKLQGVFSRICLGMFNVRHGRCNLLDRLHCVPNRIAHGRKRVLQSFKSQGNQVHGPGSRALLTLNFWIRWMRPTDPESRTGTHGHVRRFRPVDIPSCCCIRSTCFITSFTQVLLLILGASWQAALWWTSRSCFPGPCSSQLRKSQQLDSVTWLMNCELCLPPWCSVNQPQPSRQLTDCLWLSLRWILLLPIFLVWV